MPVELNDKLLVDGAIVENIPTASLQSMGAEIIVGVDLNSRQNIKRPENIIDVLLNAFDYTLMNASKLQSEGADILITTYLSAFNLIDLEQIPALIEKGYEDTRKLFKEIVR